MNFHLELRKSSCRKELKRRTGRSMDVLEVRRHELTAACSPKWAPCRIRYYPGVGRIYVSGPAGNTSAGRIRWRMQSTSWPVPIQAKYCPSDGLLNGKEPLQ